MTDEEAYEFYANPAHLEIAGPARKHPKDQLTKALSVRVSPSMLNQVTAAAAAADCTAGAWVRRVLRDELQRARAAARAAVPRPEGLIEGSGHRGEPRTLSSSLGLKAWAFTCPHLSVGGVASASCVFCGPLEAA